MATAKLGILILTGIIVASSIGGCASTAHHYQRVVYVPVYVPEPHPWPQPMVYSEPPAPVSSQSGQRYTPLAKPDAEATATKTHEARQVPVSEMTRTSAAQASRIR